MGKPDPPQPPNPIATAAAQTGTNVGTAVANAFLNNTNQVTPQGSLTFNPTGNYQWTDPTIGQTYNIPTFTATQTLAPTQQATLNASEQAKLNLAQLAQSQSSRLQGLLGTNVDISGAPGPGDPNALNAGPIQTSLGNTGNVTTSYGDPSGFEADRQAAQDALMGRLDPQLAIEKNQALQSLKDKGIQPGSPAYQATMDQYGRQANDARLAVIANATTQQTAMADMAAQKAGFQNAAQQQQFSQAQAGGQFYNAAQQQKEQQASTIFSAQNANRAQYLSELYAQRNQPINETTALLSGSQVQNPSFINAPQNQIPTTDIAGIINQNFAQQEQNFQAQSTANNALVGGILGAAGGWLRSDRDVKENIGKIGSVLAADADEAPKKLPIFKYSYADDPASTMHIGPMAQDVEKINPAAVKSIGGVKHINPRMVMGSILGAA